MDQDQLKDQIIYLIQEKRLKSELLISVHLHLAPALIHQVIEELIAEGRLYRITRRPSKK